MKILIAYYSVTGNTKLLAEAVHKAVLLKGHQADIRPCSSSTPETVVGYDLVFVGSACHDADLAVPAKDFLDGIPAGLKLKVSGFVTHATTMPDGTARNDGLYDKWAGRCGTTLEEMCKDKALDFLGYFHCPGAPSPAIADFIHREIMPDESDWEVYIEEIMQHPDEGDIVNVREFANLILEKAE